MKKLVILVLFLTLVLIPTSCATKKQGIELPNTNEIKSVKIEQNSKNFEITTSDQILELVEQIGMGKPTSKKSVQDVPNVNEYVKIYFNMKDDSTSTLFIYQEENEWYIEKPYIGVYSTNDDLINIISKVIQQ